MQGGLRASRDRCSAGCRITWQGELRHLPHDRQQALKQEMKGGWERRTVPCLHLHVFTSSRITSCPRYSSVTSFEVVHPLTYTQSPSRPCTRPIPFPASPRRPSFIPPLFPSFLPPAGQQGRGTGVGRELSRTNLIRAFNGHSFREGLGAPGCVFSPRRPFEPA